MSRIRIATAVVLTLAASACESDRVTSLNEITATPAAQVQLKGFAAPSEVVSVTQGGDEANIWSYTSTGFSTTPQDPVNLIFFGASDPREIRAVLLGLSGSGRPGPLASFSCTWSDAVGDPQTSYSEGAGWVPSSIQLQCGNFQGPRFHVRIFREATSLSPTLTTKFSFRERISTKC